MGQQQGENNLNITFTGRTHSQCWLIKW
jgi:hypothetical protein